jgi:hypothetical protein
MIDTASAIQPVLFICYPLRNVFSDCVGPSVSCLQVFKEHNIELSCPADHSTAAPVCSNAGVSPEWHPRGQLQRLVMPTRVMAGCFELKPIPIGENRLEVATCCRQLRASTRAAPSEPRCCVYRFTSMRAPFPADASPPSREMDPTVSISSILFSIPFLPARFCGGHSSGGHNIELSRPADLREPLSASSDTRQLFRTTSKGSAPTTC